MKLPPNRLTQERTQRKYNNKRKKQTYIHIHTKNLHYPKPPFTPNNVTTKAKW